MRFVIVATFSDSCYPSVPVPGPTLVQLLTERVLFLQKIGCFKKKSETVFFQQQQKKQALGSP